MNLQVTNDWAALTNTALITLTLQNKGRAGDIIEVITGDTKPLDLDRGFALAQINKVYRVSGYTGSVWVRYIRYDLTGTITPSDARICLLDVQEGSQITEVSDVPIQLVTTQALNESSRVKTESGSTAFSLARAFRTFREFNLSNGESLTIKIVTPINIMLDGLIINLNSGSVRYEGLVGGTEVGVFDTPITPFNLNGRTDAPVYSPLLTLATGGSLTGGILTDLAIMATGTNSQRTSVVEGLQSMRGAPPGTYYIRLTAESNATNAIIYSVWEEWPD